MKRKTICAIVVATLILGVGCKKKEEVVIEEPSGDVIVEQQEVERKAYTLHNELLPKVKEVFEESGYAYEGYEEVNNEYYSGYTGLLYTDKTEIKDGNVYEARYSVGTDADGLTGVFVNLHMQINEEDVKANGIKLEDTFLAKMDKAVTGENYNFTEMDNEIKKSVESDNVLNETKINGKVHRSIYREGNTINYVVSVYPE